MSSKIAFFLAVLAVANAAYLSGPAYPHAAYSYAAPLAAPAVVSQHGNILRSHGNAAQVSAYSKSISTPHSSVYKSDVRVSNDVHAYPYVQGYAAAPAYGHSYAAPTYSHAYAAPAYSHGYAAPAYGNAYVAPAYAHGYGAHAPTSLVGVAYSPATAAAHFSYSNGYGLHYSY